MRVLDQVVLPKGRVRHYARRHTVELGNTEVELCTTICGSERLRYPSSVVHVVTGDRKSYDTPMCKRCAATMSAHPMDAVIPEPTEATIDRASEVGRITEVEGRVFRVAGRQDTYTVTVPTDPYLATLCTCMAGKVHPDTQCKHQVAVLAAIGETEEAK